MRGVPVTAMRAMVELERLLRVYARPHHAPSDSIEFAQTYVETLGDVSAEQFSQAVGEYLRTDARFFPKPGELRAIALKMPGSQLSAGPVTVRAWALAGGVDAAGRMAPCPCCNRAWQWSPRLHCVHNHIEHRRAGEPCIGNCDEPKCLGAGLHHGTPVRESAGDLWEPPSVILARALPPAPVPAEVQGDIL